LIESIKIDVNVIAARIDRSLLLLLHRRKHMDDGLEGVIAAGTVLSDVDGAAGQLVLRGFTLDRIAAHWSCEQVLALLFDGFFEALPPTGMRAALAQARIRAFGQLRADDPGLLRTLTPVEALRALLARMPDGEALADALQLVAAVAVFTAALSRWRSGQAAVAPDIRFSHAADLLRMLHGSSPSPSQVAGLDTYLVTVSDHGLNASTFAARVVASTGAGLSSAVVSGLSALKGPLHGGAPGPVLDMLDAIAEPGQARPWLEDAIARGDRLMGFGHRVYRVRDPRADALKQALQGLSAGGAIDKQRLALAESVERVALDLLREKKPGRPLETNVEFYTALLLEALGFERELFTCVFAAGRVGGWIAHAREQVLRGRLIRPQSVYVGPAAQQQQDQQQAAPPRSRQPSAAG
jgi:citrate synthase